MKFFDGKKEWGYSPATDEQRKISLFWPLSFGWWSNSLPVSFSCLTVAMAMLYALKRNRRNKVNCGIP
jgi:hypothetical protein